MRYLNRADVERTGRGGCVAVTNEKGSRARVLGSFWLYVDPNDKGFSPHMLESRDGFWEAWITYWMSTHVEPGWRCIDVGANMGYYTLFLLQHGCWVQAFEPQPHLADLIERSVDENHLATKFGGIRQVAVSDSHGAMTMTVPEGHGMNASIVDRVASAHDRKRAIHVETTTLDDLYGKNRFDFIKVDVEGAEDKLFRGAQRFIERNPRCLWLLEWRWDRMKDPERSAREIFERMHVWWVDYDGNEQPLNDPCELSSKQHEDWMLVLRTR
jgi:FkbM family methyltransferase